MKPQNHPRRTLGFTLTEVLISLLVLGIGLLGLAALQARGVKFNHDAGSRSEATLLAYQIMDQMRANRAQAAAYLGSPDSSTCAPTTVSVQNDINCWYAAIGQVLPAGTAQIASTGTDTYDVTIKWQERGARNPTSANECTRSGQLAQREWDSSLGICRVTQSWSLRLLP